MANMLLGYDNKADNATYSGGSWPTLALTNIKDPRPSKKARSADLTLSNTLMNIDLGASYAIRMIAITHTNLSSAGLYRITWYSDAFTTAVGNTGWLAIPGYPATDPDGIGAAIFHVFASANTYRYWRIELDDNTNAAGYIEVGRVFLPLTWAPSINYGADNADGMEPNTPVQTSLGGTKYFSRRKPARTFRFGFDVIDDSELPTMRAIRKISNLNKQVVIIPDPSDTSYLNDTCFVGTLAQTPPLKRLVGADLAAASFDVTEAV